MADFEKLKEQADDATILMMEQIGANVEETALAYPRLMVVNSMALFILLTAEGLRDTVWDAAEPVPLNMVPKHDKVPAIIEALRSSADALEAATLRTDMPDPEDGN